MTAEDPGVERARVEAELARDSFRESLRGPSSYLAAIERHELPVGESLTLHGHTIDALPAGFRVDGQPTGPTIVDAGRYRLRLSHQNAPAVVVLDAEAPRPNVRPMWFPYDPSFRFVLPLDIDAADIAIGSTREQTRPASRAGWFAFEVAHVACRLAALRLNEPGVAADALDLYFSDATSGRETYRMRYVGVAPAERGRFVIDFNRAYNPACVYSRHYNCPIPPPENALSVAIRAGEMMPVWEERADE